MILECKINVRNKTYRFVRIDFFNLCMPVHVPKALKFQRVLQICPLIRAHALWGFYQAWLCGRVIVRGHALCFCFCVFVNEFSRVFITKKAIRPRT